MSKKSLSIIIITMNRQNQLIEALNSCIACVLPKDVEIIVINNGSTDNTAVVLEEYASSHDIKFVIKNLPQNVGAGEGRNIAIANATGKYLFFLDDDAVIDVEYNKDIFIEAINILESNPQIATLTAMIYDECLNTDRSVVHIRNKKYSDLKPILEVHGGGFFVKKHIINAICFPGIYYGFEELLPSIVFIDLGYINVYSEKFRIIHRPQVNKWNGKSDILIQQKRKVLAGLITVKYILYPVVLRPFIYAGFLYRCLKHFGLNLNIITQCFCLHKEQIKMPTNRKFARIKFKTIIFLLKNYGIRVVI